MLGKTIKHFKDELSLYFDFDFLDCLNNTNSAKFITLTSQKSKMSTQIWHRTSQVSLLRSFPKNSYLFIKQYPKIGIHTLKLFLELFLITTIPIMLFQSASL